MPLVCRVGEVLRRGWFLIDGRLIRPYDSATIRLFRDRLMVGQRPLKPCILVRIQVPEPHKPTAQPRSVLSRGLPFEASGVH